MKLQNKETELKYEKEKRKKKRKNREERVMKPKGAEPSR